MARSAGGRTGAIRRAPRVRRGDDNDAGEDAFERWVVQMAHLYDWCGFHVRRSYGAVVGVHHVKQDLHDDAFGWPDWWFLSARRGRAIIRELKTETGPVMDDQERWLRDLRACGFDAKVWRPSDRAEIIRTFSAG